MRKEHKTPINHGNVNKLILPSTSKVFSISDNHWGHTNIIKYCNRPFSSVEEMNEVMISKWNSVVSDTDIIIHVGDFALCKKEEIIEIGKRLNGIKYLVLGNHDRAKIDVYKESGFLRVFDTGKVLVEYGEKRFFFSHRPLFSTVYNCQNQYNASNCEKWYFGHTHHNNPDSMTSGFHVNLCVEQIDYTPVRIFS